MQSFTVHVNPVIDECDNVVISEEVQSGLNWITAVETIDSNAFNGIQSVITLDSSNNVILFGGIS